ncbi:uncharacterized protein DDB_G0271670-like [Pistacia vera]|uniref:uncharacterized protein DDB_G0271670-like n=1 Tax=Pistacia vera TaxID=55513 RepID=UPI0012636C93|nr:uncharacterized protein DDB_G0271670-like [Pistacia vera]
MVANIKPGSMHQRYYGVSQQAYNPQADHLHTNLSHSPSFSVPSQQLFVNSQAHFASIGLEHVAQFSPSTSVHGVPGNYISTSAHQTQHTSPTALATTYSPVDLVWYMDSGATDHVAFELNQLNISKVFDGTEKLQSNKNEICLPDFSNVDTITIAPNVCCNSSQNNASHSTSHLSKSGVSKSKGYSLSPNTTSTYQSSTFSPYVVISHSPSSSGLVPSTVSNSQLRFSPNITIVGKHVSSPLLSQTTSTSSAPISPSMSPNHHIISSPPCSNSSSSDQPQSIFSTSSSSSDFQTVSFDPSLPIKSQHVFSFPILPPNYIPPNYSLKFDLKIPSSSYVLSSQPLQSTLSSHSINPLARSSQSCSLADALHYSRPHDGSTFQVPSVTNVHPMVTKPKSTAYIPANTTKATDSTNDTNTTAPFNAFTKYAISTDAHNSEAPKVIFTAS